MILVLLFSCLSRLNSSQEVFCYEIDGDVSTSYTSKIPLILHGENLGDQAGFSVSAFGDADGDGLNDIGVGAPAADSGRGKVYLKLASSLEKNIGIGLKEHSLGDSNYSFIGEEIDDQAGYAIFTAGDVDDDGLNDILIGAPGNDDGGTDAGKVYLFLGASLANEPNISLVEADYSFLGENEGDEIGKSLSIGDVDGDGKGDILISSEENGDQEGKVYLILGSSLGETSTINLSEANVSFLGGVVGDKVGVSVSNSRDIDGDEKADILIGASGNDDGGIDAGKAYLILGSSLDDSSAVNEDGVFSLTDADYLFLGSKGYDKFGSLVSFTDDMNGDEQADILIGTGKEEEEQESDQTYLFLSSSLGVNSEVSLETQGYSFEGNRGIVGKIHFDSDTNDLLVADDETVRMYRSLDFSYPFEPFGDHDFQLDSFHEATSSIPSVGDLNGDGIDEVLIGNPFGRAAGELTEDKQSGKVYVFINCATSLE